MTKKEKEQELNYMYSETYNEDEAIEQFIYLTNRNRGKGNTTTIAHIRKCYQNEKLGTLLRRLDPISFNVE